jgi:hypothetical protein
LFVSQFSPSHVTFDLWSFFRCILIVTSKSGFGIKFIVGLIANCNELNSTVHRLQIRTCVKKVSVRWDREIHKMDRRLYHLENLLESISYLLPVSSKTSSTEWYAEPSRAPNLICLPCCDLCHNGLE